MSRRNGKGNCRRPGKVVDVEHVILSLLVNVSMAVGGAFITSADIVNETITNKDIANHTIGYKKLRSSSVNTYKIANASILGKDIKNRTIPLNKLTSNVASANHSHSYTNTNHSHSYASTSHSHSYASTGHNHDSRYYTVSKTDDMFNTIIDYVDTMDDIIMDLVINLHGSSSLSETQELRAKVETLREDLLNSRDKLSQ